MVNAEFFAALEQLEKEKGIPVDYMLDRVGQALISAYKKDNVDMTDNVFVEPDRDKKTIRMYVRKTVVRAEDLYEPYEEITLEEAEEYKKNPKVGDIIDINIPTKSFGRIAAQAAKQVIIQGIREAERGMVISEFESKEHEILTGVVTSIDPHNGSVYLDVVSGGEKSEAVLTSQEQVRGEQIKEGGRVKVYLLEVRRGTRGPQVAVSRTHPGLVKRLFELEVPEIYSGVVEVKSIAREAGNRTKIAVTSHDENVDPIGACVGTRGARVTNITSELNGEKIDIVKWNEDAAKFVSAALAPADVITAILQPDGKACRVIVPDDQLSLAIGKEGQNARLAAKLTGCKIDIAPLSQAGLPEKNEEPEKAAEMQDEAGKKPEEATVLRDEADAEPEEAAEPHGEADAEPEEAAEPHGEADEEPEEAAEPHGEADEEPEESAGPHGEADEEPEEAAEPRHEADEEPGEPEK